jgi:hypothetical protein
MRRAWPMARVEAFLSCGQREPLLEEKVELERRSVTGQYAGAADVRGLGLALATSGSPRSSSSVHEVDETFALELKPSSDAIFNTSTLPACSERMILKA